MVNFNPSATYGGAGWVAAWDQSRLQSGEINGRYELGEYFSLLGGVRFIEFDDNLGITSYSGSGAELAGDVAGVRNTLIGGQIGLVSHVAITERLEFDGFIKAGMFCDHASNSAQEGVIGSGPLSSAASTVNTAFVGQLQVSSTYRINDSWSIHSGYQWLWMDGVARAYGQFAHPVRPRARPPSTPTARPISTARS